ncbi:hypothetical protein V8G54_007387 [Vigna mungo]|uniref:Uncharacterized protein n=1 Tax=Vigna mungo TaxID=3915 RepID=A0AAQ3P370_VIGMU
MEEMRISQRKRQQEADVGGSRKDDKRRFDNNDKNGDLPRTFKFNHYTTLNAPRAKNSIAQPLGLMYSALRPQLFNSSASKVLGHSTSQIFNHSASGIQPFGPTFLSTGMFSRNSQATDGHSRLLGCSLGTPGPQTIILELLDHERNSRLLGCSPGTPGPQTELQDHKRSFSSTGCSPGTLGSLKVILVYWDVLQELLGHRWSFSSTGIDGSSLAIQSRTTSKSRDGSGMKEQCEARKVFGEGFNEGVRKKQGISSSESLPRGKEARGEGSLGDLGRKVEHARSAIQVKKKILQCWGWAPLEWGAGRHLASFCASLVFLLGSLP